MTIKALEIVDYGETFETHKSRILRRLTHVLIPNSHDGEAYQELMQYPDAAELFAAWILTLQVASRRCRDRGLLVKDNGKAHDPRSLAARTHGRAAWFEKLIPVALKLGWLRWRNVEEEEEKTAIRRRSGANAALTRRSPGADPALTRRSPGANPATIKTIKTKKTDSLSVCLSGGGALPDGEGPPLAPSENPATPPPLEAILAFAQADGIPEAAALAFDRHFGEIGWVDPQGRPLRSWKARLRYWATDWRRRANGEGRKPPPKPKKPATTTPSAPPKPLGEVLAEDPKAREILKAEVAKMRQKLER